MGPLSGAPGQTRHVPLTPRLLLGTACHPGGMEAHNIGAEGHRFGPGYPASPPESCALVLPFQPLEGFTKPILADKGRLHFR